MKENGEQPHWEAERVAEYEACEAGAAALISPGGRDADQPVREERQPLDARAHAGDGDGAAKEAGAQLASSFRDQVIQATVEAFNKNQRPDLAAARCALTQAREEIQELWRPLHDLGEDGRTAHGQSKYYAYQKSIQVLDELIAALTGPT